MSLFQINFFLTLYKIFLDQIDEFICALFTDIQYY